MIALRCKRCDVTEPILVREDDPHFDTILYWRAKEHEMTYHTPPVWLVVVGVFSTIAFLWVVAS